MLALTELVLVLSARIDAAYCVYIRSSYWLRCLSISYAASSYRVEVSDIGLTKRHPPEICRSAWWISWVPPSQGDPVVSWDLLWFILSVQISCWKANQTTFFFLNLNAYWLDDYDIILTSFLAWPSNKWKLSIKLLNIFYLSKGHQVNFVEWKIAACGKSLAENTLTGEEITSPPSESVITDFGLVNKYRLWEHSFRSVFKELEQLINSVIC